MPRVYEMVLAAGATLNQWRRVMTSVRRLAVCLGCCVAGLAVSPTTALGERSSSVSEVSSTGSSLDGGLLTSPFEPSAESEPARVPERKRSMSPAALQTRVRSRMKFAHLGSAQAAQVAREAFPTEIEHPLDGGPSVPAGGRIVRYSSDKAAQIELPSGKRAVVESLWPMALETSHGHHEPVDLGLTKVGGVYESMRPVVGVLNSPAIA